MTYNLNLALPIMLNRTFCAETVEIPAAYINPDIRNRIKRTITTPKLPMHVIATRRDRQSVGWNNKRTRLKP